MRFATDRFDLRPEIPHLLMRSKSMCICVCYILYFIFFGYIAGRQLKTVERF